MKKDHVNSHFDGGPEEWEDLQLTDEEIGMVSSGVQAETPVCPWCKCVFPDDVTLKRHLTVCTKNPNRPGLRG